MSTDSSRGNDILARWGPMIVGVIFAAGLSLGAQQYNSLRIDEQRQALREHTERPHPVTEQRLIALEVKAESAAATRTEMRATLTRIDSQLAELVRATDALCVAMGPQCRGRRSER